MAESGQGGEGSSRDATSGDAVAEYARRIMARVHDGPLQDLVAANLTLAVMRRRTGYASLEDITEVSRLVDMATAQLRAIIVGRDEAAIRSDLFTELRDLCAAFEADTGIACRATLDAEHLAFPPEVADVVYRAVRELLTNVRKHAQASAVEVSSAVLDDGDAVVTVVDNGIGLADANRHRAVAERGVFGLWSIEQRLRALGGFLELDNVDGLRATLVLPRESRDAG